MPCFSPLYMSRRPDGQFDISAKPRGDGYTRVSCGQCVGCLLRRSRDWAVRGVHQSRISPDGTSHFVTLTYSDEFLPRHPKTGVPTFELDAISAFMKRLRTNTGQQGIKFLGCREYGERTLRPHYHLCLFGLDLQDYRPYKVGRHGFNLFNSDTLGTAWQGRGHVVVAPASFNTISYTARYVLKKLGSKVNPMSREYASDLLTGEIYEHLPERSYCSRRPAIGYDFFNQHAHGLIGLGSTIIGNRRMPLPRYYLRLCKDRFPDLYAEYEIKREQYYRDAEFFNDSLLLQAMKTNLENIDRAVRSVV